ncbi:MAG: hypothetical protein HY775_11410 [Acidobacteria bacterium]|nr:hypothetical protein [Acidobacteriota bacterium]
MRAGSRAIAAIALALLPVVPGGASAVGPEAPATAGWIKLPVKAGDAYSLQCDSGRLASDFIVERFEGSDGGGWDSWSAGGPGGGMRARAKLGSIDRSIEWAASPSSNGFRHEGSVGSAGVLRVSWALWGDPATCIFSLGGTSRAWSELDRARGAHLTTYDFPTGAAAGPASLVETYDRTSSGFLAALLVPGEIGVAQVAGPEGQSYLGAGESPWIAIAEPTSGTWSYRVHATAGLTTTELWLLEIPA